VVDIVDLVDTVDMVDGAHDRMPLADYDYEHEHEHEHITIADVSSEVFWITTR